MKRIFTLIAATFLTAAVFAASDRPDVTLKTSRNYEVIIDGHSYFGNSTMNLPAIRKGQHSIKVYEINNSRFRKFKKLVSASSFQLKKNDLFIVVDFRGQISITEDRFGRNSRNDRDDSYGWNGNDGRDRDSYDKDQRNDKNDRDKKRF